MSNTNVVSNDFEDFVSVGTGLSNNRMTVPDIIRTMNDCEVETIKVSIQRQIVVTDVHTFTSDDLRPFRNRGWEEFLEETKKVENIGDLDPDYDGLEVMNVEIVHPKQSESPTLDEWIKSSRSVSHGSVCLTREDVEHNSCVLDTDELLKLREDFLKSGQTDEYDFIKETLGSRSTINDYQWDTNEIDIGYPVFRRK